MCTVTYIPFPNSDYILTQNRDVGFERAEALGPAKREYKGKEIVFPVDPQGGGTWNAYSESHHAFILNGADYDYYPDFDAPKSRGSLCLDLLTEGPEFLEKEDLSVYDDFTLVYFPIDQSDFIREFRWNGEELVCEMKNIRIPQIWISRGLYTHGDYKRKKKIFHTFIESIDRDSGIESISLKIWDFHQITEVDGQEGFCIERPPMVRTVSTFQIQRKSNQVELRYRNH